MNDEDTVEPQLDNIAEVEQQDAVTDMQEDDQVAQKETQVPLSALQKERKKRQELELELQWTRQQQQRQVEAPQEDNSKYESATREDLSRSHEETIRAVEERMWIKQNPEKYEKINEYLPTFLKQRPNLASAINSASNRYEEAYELMDKLTPKQQEQVRKASVPKREAPNAPTNAPKAASMNASVDVMNMSDSEFDTWRSSQRRR